MFEEGTFAHFKDIHCDKCGSVSSYSPHVIDDVVECFGCKCNRLEAMTITCECGWTGNYFEQENTPDLSKRICPVCLKDGYNEPTQTEQGKDGG